MKVKEIISIVILIILYLIAFENTLIFYYFPYPLYPNFSLFLSHIPQNFLIYILILEIIWILIPFLVPGLKLLTNAYRKLSNKKIPLSKILLYSIGPIILIIINNYITGNLLFSIILLIYCFLFVVFAFVLRYLENEDFIKLSEFTDDKKMMEGLDIYIMELDYLRPPVNIGIGPYPMIKSFELISGEDKRYYFLRHNENLYQIIRKELSPFFEESLYSYSFTKTEFGSTELLNRNLIKTHSKVKESRDFFPHMSKYDVRHILQPLYVFSIYSVLLCFIIIIILTKLDLNLFHILLGITTSITILYLIFIWLFTKNRRIAGEKYDENIKKSVQELIDYGIEFVKKNELDPDDFPLSLRHNDYDGLIYEKKGENNYLGFFEK